MDNADAVFSLWLETRDPLKVVEESFLAEGHRIAMSQHAARKAALVDEFTEHVRHLRALTNTRQEKGIPSRFGFGNSGRTSGQKRERKKWQ